MTAIAAIAPLASFASFLSAVVQSERNGEKDARLSFEAAAAGLNEGTGNLGGFLVPENLSTEIWARVYATGRLLARCDRQPVTKGNGVTIPVITEKSRVDGEQPEGSRFGGAQMYWTDEAGPADASVLKFDLLKLTLHKLLGLIYAADELTEDAPALAAAVNRMFGLEASFSIEDAIINGNGVAQPLGILNSPSLIKVAGGIEVATLTGMAKRLWGPSHNSAVWLMGADVFGQVLDLHIENGGLLETGPNGERMLLQMPVEICEYAAPVGTNGDLILGDFSQYIIAEKPAQTLSSIHVRFVSDESVFKVRYRVDGAPAWKTPLTPNNSDATQSPFIARGDAA